MVLAENRSERRVAGTFVLAPLVLKWRDEASESGAQANALRPSEARGARRIARDIGGSCPDVHSPTAGIGTELLAPGEKIEVTRSGSPFERSPVPMARAHRPYTRVVCALPRRIPQTWDSLAERGEFELPVPICEQSDYNKESPLHVGTSSVSCSFFSSSCAGVAVVSTGGGLSCGSGTPRSTRIFTAP
jgi:hypothetical protein